MVMPPINPPKFTIPILENLLVDRICFEVGAPQWIHPICFSVSTAVSLNVSPIVAVPLMLNLQIVGVVSVLNVVS
jgi:hypothetical protein